jgi:SAM-dependent methyltransferase
MYVDEYRIMFEVEDSHWWYRGLHEFAIRCLDRLCGPGANLELLDAGCGTGAMLRHLQRYGYAIGIDVSTEALRFCRQRGLDERCAFEGSVLDLPFDDRAFDLVVSFDVICCIDPGDQPRAFAELARVVRPGGRLIVNLPAYPALYSEHDRAVHIQRRYTARSLRAELEDARLTVERLTYHNTILFPLIALVRLWKKRYLTRTTPPRSDVTLTPAPINELLRLVLSIEARWLQFADLPFGLSVFAIARK